MHKQPFLDRTKMVLTACQEASYVQGSGLCGGGPRSGMWLAISYLAVPVERLSV